MSLHIGNFWGVCAVSGTKFAATGAATEILPQNWHRRMASFYNYSESIMFLKLGSNVSTSDFTVKLGSGSYYEMPLPIYTGSISALWLSETGSVMITEFTSD